MYRRLLNAFCRYLHNCPQLNTRPTSCTIGRGCKLYLPLFVPNVAIPTLLFRTLVWGKYHHFGLTG